VIVVNARHATMTGRKMTEKKYYRYTGYPGGLRERTFKQMIDRHPEKTVEHAIRGMIPHNRLGRKVYKKLHVYADGHHPHQAQKPEPLKI
jgi:large subunit ribosomal protein L13